jgi:two-component system sensor histidine kinase QseC
MRSIRRYLTAWLLAGFALLWVAAGAGIYLLVRAGLLKAIDAELALDAGVIRHAMRGREPEDAGIRPDGRAFSRMLEGRVPAYQRPGSGAYYQAWTGYGRLLERSPSLGDRSLVFPARVTAGPLFQTAQIEELGAVRMMSCRMFPPSKGRGKGSAGAKARGGSNDGTVIVIARDIASIDQVLSALSGGIFIVGLLVAGLAVLLVRTALHRGLKPLRDLGAQTGAIDAGSLETRFNATGAPAELRPICERLNDLMARLQNSFDRERRFSSDLAHEMRTPVAELKAIAAVALKWPGSAAENTHRETLEIARQLERTIENLLALARWESGEVPVRDEVVDLSPIIRECWESHSDLADKRSLRVTIRLDPGTALRADADMLRHTLGNLMANAAEYTPEGGEIRVSVLPDGLDIANTAPDVTAGDLEHLFERCWRGDPARAGTRHAGLGLSIARSCADAMGLHLTASREGDLLHFTLRKRHSSRP